MASIPLWAVSKMLYTPRGVQALTTAYKLSLSPQAGTRVVQGAISGSLARAARAAGLDLQALPAMADQSDSEPPK